MTPAVQRWVVFALVVASALYLSWRGWRSWRASVAASRSTGCGPDCGCG